MPMQTIQTVGHCCICAIDKKKRIIINEWKDERIPDANKWMGN